MKEKTLMLRPKYWASVSGGKDSLFMLHYILNHLDKYPLDGVVHYDLEVDFPFVKNVINEMRKRCEEHDIVFYSLKPRNSWMELYEKYGYPTRRARWCNAHYKLDCSAQLDKIMKMSGCYAVHYIGFCADENNRFRVPLFERENVTYIYPLAEAGINEIDIWKWARNFEMFNDYYKYCFRQGCAGCPLSSKQGLAYLYVYYPEMFEHFMKLAEHTEKIQSVKYNRPFSVWCSNAKYNTEYIRKIIPAKYVPLKELQIKE